MNVIVHRPIGEKERNELARRAAELHAAAVVQHIESLSCPRAQKLALLDAIVQKRKQEGSNE